MADEITDETCIAIAVLHGAHFHEWVAPAPDAHWGCWNTSIRADRDAAWLEVSGATRAAAARRYCERHNLLR